MTTKVPVMMIKELKGTSSCGIKQMVMSRLFYQRPLLLHFLASRQL
jgi:hypothetical protein